MNHLSKKISMQDIADSLGISRQTVSLALSGKEGVKEGTRELIIATARRMNYGNILIGSSESNKILVLIPEHIRHGSQFYSNIYWSIEEHAKNKNRIAILVTVSNEMQKKQELPKVYYEMDFEGLILVGIFEESYVEHVAKNVKNIVSVDQYYKNTTINCVLTANSQGCYNITKHIINQGHSEIGFIGSIHMTASIYDRWCGYTRAMLEAGFNTGDNYSILDSTPIDVLLGDAGDLAVRLNKLPKFPTAWVCGGDMIAFALIDALKGFGLKVPRDISVAGFDNIETWEIIKPALTTVRVNREMLGIIGVDRLIEIAAGSQTVTATSIFTDLIIRDSVKAFESTNEQGEPQ